MKQYLILVFTIILVVSLSGCANSSGGKGDAAPIKTSRSSSESKDDIINITEKMYVGYINDIYMNAEDYIGKTIKLEGMFLSENYPPEEMDYHQYVYRTGPGCCGNDGAMCGFEISYEGKLPENNDWVETTGTLKTYDKEGIEYIYLNVTELNVLDERGAETVYQ